MIISDDAWRRIDEYQKALGYDMEAMTAEERHKYARECCLALYQEVSELTDSFQWKPWRGVEEPDHENMKREGVDIVFFLHHILACFRIGPYQLNDTFEEVIKNDYKRIHEGYNNKKEDRI